MPSMAQGDLDPLLLDPTRLAIMSLLAGTRWAEFGWVRESVDMSASALSKQVTTLSGNAYVEVDKGYVGKRPRTWLNITAEGRAALERHVTGLQRIVEDSRRAAEAVDAVDVDAADGRPTGAGRPPGRREGPPE